jgi:replicative DNA helicase
VTPYNNDAEQSVLGSVIIDNSQLDTVRPIIRTPEAFYAESHRIIWRHALSLSECGQPIDNITLIDSLRRSGELEKAGGTLYVLGLAEVVPTSLYSDHYARIVARDFTARQALEAGQRIAKLAENSDLNADELAAQALELAGSVQAGTERSTADLAAALDAEYRAGKARARGEQPEGTVTSGLHDVDRIMTGFEPGKLYVLAARPSVGKSALALTFALAAAKHGALTLFYSLEMQEGEISARAACQLARVDAAKLKAGTLSPREEADLFRARDAIKRWPFKVFVCPDLTLEELRAGIRREARGQQVGLVVVDYLQLMRYSGRAGNREQEVAGLSMGLKKLAMGLPCPVLALAQLNRAVEGRGDKRPILSDLRESGSVEQDADVVMMLYRDDAYDPASARAGRAEVIYRKHRGGRTGTVELQFHPQHVAFNDLTLAPLGGAR